MIRKEYDNFLGQLFEDIYNVDYSHPQNMKIIRDNFDSFLQSSKYVKRVIENMNSLKDMGHYVTFTV